MLPLLSTAYLPPISYIALLVQNKGAIIEVEENFEKQSYRNRTVIFGANGLQNLTVPVQHGSSKTCIKDLKISYQENWPVLHWRAFLSAYKGRPFFDIVAEDIKHVLDKKLVFLLDLNDALLYLILDWLQDNSKVSRTNTFSIAKGDKHDFRYQLHPKKESVLVETPPYFQHFSRQHGFMPDLSIIDLIFSEGRASWDYLNELKFKTEN